MFADFAGPGAGIVSCETTFTTDAPRYREINKANETGALTEYLLGCGLRLCVSAVKISVFIISPPPPVSPDCNRSPLDCCPESIVSSLAEYLPTLRLATERL